MSRIDISVTDKNSGELIENIGFCRSPHLTYFCEEYQDSKIRNFSDSIFLGKDITKENIEDFNCNGILCIFSFFKVMIIF